MAATLTRSITVLTEDDIATIFTYEGMWSNRWSSGVGDFFSVHSHGYHKTLFCVRGSITFTFPDSGNVFELSPVTVSISKWGRAMQPSSVLTV